MLSYPLAFPSLVPTSASRPRLRNPSMGGGAGIDGTEQVVVAPGGGSWAWSATFDCRGDRDDLLALEAFILGMQGRAGTALAPIFDGKRAPWKLDPLTGGALTPAKDAASLAADPAFATNPDTFGALSFSLAVDAPLNGTTVSIVRGAGGIVRPGMFFSLASELHAIVALDAPDTGGAGPLNAAIVPWLRAAHPAGTAVEFGRPVSLARFASDDTGKAELDLLRFGRCTLDFVEAH